MGSDHAATMLEEVQAAVDCFDGSEEYIVSTLSKLVDRITGNGLWPPFKPCVGAQDAVFAQDVNMLQWRHHTLL